MCSGESACLDVRMFKRYVISGLQMSVVAVCVVEWL